MARQITLNDIVSYKVEANFAGSNPEYTYITDWGDGCVDKTAGLATHYIAHRYDTVGTFNPTVTIRDDKKGCWKVFNLDTIYVLGVTISAATTNWGVGDYPEITYTIDGSYDFAAGNNFRFKTKWCYGDGSEVFWGSEVNPTTMPHSGTMNTHQYSTAGGYTLWLALKITESEFDELESKPEISNLLPIVVGAGTAPAPMVHGRILTTDTTEGTSIFGLFVDSGTGPFTVEVDWGDGSVETYTNVPHSTIYSIAHAFPASNGATMYSPIFTITDTNGGVGTLEYTLYVVPKVALIPEFGGTSLKTGVEQSTIIYAGKGPYSVYFDISIQHDSRSESTPKCKVKVVTDNTVSTTSQTQYFPSSATWYGPGAQTFVVSNVTKDFTIELDHNLSVDSYNSMVIRAYVIDNNGSVSQKVNLVRYGKATNIEVTGV